MFKKFSRAWDIAKMCWKVLRLDKELIVFPLMSLATCGLLLAMVIVPVWASGQWEAVVKRLAAVDEEGNINFLTLAFDFAGYFVAYFVMIFFNAGLVACAKIRFRGGDPTVADGLKASFARLPQIFVWALITSVVGFLLNKASNTQKGIGKFIFGLLGAGWALASFFVVPVLVSENVGPVTALRKSVSVIKKTWGELLIAEVGMSALSVLVVMPAFLMFFLGIVSLGEAPVLAFPIFAIAATWLFLTGLAFTTLSTILQTALYLYATEGKIPDQFDPDIIQNPASRQ